MTGESSNSDNNYRCEGGGDRNGGGDGIGKQDVPFDSVSTSTCSCV